ncbi:MULTISPECIES: helix-turn-helix domain-containing protein [unclassified Bosea (in: a-proteobacteria)]|uniref:helix-turn-helix transcriptional regulator n=1 Tax=unclassified Bosea (in: a-proteobacteria) TaxID=2653178 RepID=UPI000F74E5E7|nr:MULTISPECIES: helix-turn-helix domain-containing protein [unclassified Bosea (in: a-proteobacteria)]AZO77502.1 hypothetical protein BLM15_07650 [Bosea sp. Tri-49]RXT18108.1 hypothetical protein B5U98_22810 [Bosea sp. Tri-39]RXT32706.1 hypothetical protein B5U99_29155 [Bosea sp. Tri-54]
MSSNNFKALRERCGLTQGELAVLLGVSTRTINAQEAKAEVDQVYWLALERVALFAANRRGDPMIAPANVRKEAAELVRALVG